MYCYNYLLRVNGSQSILIHIKGAIENLQVSNIYVFTFQYFSANKMHTHNGFSFICKILKLTHECALLSTLHHGKQPFWTHMFFLL
jgi:hypothetical protein